MPNPLREPVVLVIFGGGGDLTHRKLVPAVLDLFIDGWIAIDRLAIIGIDRKPSTDEAYRSDLRSSAAEFCDRGPLEARCWDPFAESISYLSGDFNDPKLFDQLSERLAALEKRWNSHVQR
ncbi:MAG TPA: hypothetical protein VGH32_12355, partial [Pirellulales bacterium]